MSIKKTELNLCNNCAILKECFKDSKVDPYYINLTSKINTNKIELKKWCVDCYNKCLKNEKQ